jgi:hypothetical protein
MMAALFALIGLVAMAIVGIGSRTSHAEAPAAEPASASSTETSDIEMDPADLLTPEIRSFLASAAPMALPGIARGVGRNLPLILILALLGFIISRFGIPGSETQASEGNTAGNDAAEVPPAAAA